MQFCIRLILHRSGQQTWADGQKLQVDSLLISIKTLLLASKAIVQDGNSLSWVCISSAALVFW